MFERFLCVLGSGFFCVVVVVVVVVVVAVVVVVVVVVTHFWAPRGTPLKTAITL